MSSKCSSGLNPFPEEPSPKPTHEWAFAHGWTAGADRYWSMCGWSWSWMDYIRKSRQNSPRFTKIANDRPRSEAWHYWQVVTGEPLPPGVESVLDREFLPETESTSAKRSWRLLSHLRFADPAAVGELVGVVCEAAFFNQCTFGRFMDAESHLWLAQQAWSDRQAQMVRDSIVALNLAISEAKFADQVKGTLT